MNLLINDVSKRNIELCWLKSQILTHKYSFKNKKDTEEIEHFY